MFAGGECLEVVYGFESLLNSCFTARVGLTRSGVETQGLVCYSQSMDLKYSE